MLWAYSMLLTQNARSPSHAGSATTMNIQNRKKAMFLLTVLGITGHQPVPAMSVVVVRLALEQPS